MTLQDYYNSGDNAQGAIFPEYDSLVAQTFVASSDYDIHSVKLKLDHYSGSGDYTLSIQGVNGGGYPDGNVLLSKTVAHTALPTSPDWFEFVFDSPITLSASSQYAIVMEGTGSVFGRWRLHEDGSTYANGKACVSLFGAPWDDQPITPSDFMFEVYGDVYDPIKLLSSSLALSLSAEASASLSLALQASTGIDFQMSANMKDTRDVLLSAVLPVTFSVSANLPAFWRAPVETGMRNYLVAAVKNKLYYGS